MPAVRADRVKWSDERWDGWERVLQSSVFIYAADMMELLHVTEGTVLLLPGVKTFGICSQIRTSIRSWTGPEVFRRTRVRGRSCQWAGLAAGATAAEGTQGPPHWHGVPLWVWGSNPGTAVRVTKDHLMLLFMMRGPRKGRTNQEWARKDEDAFKSILEGRPC